MPPPTITRPKTARPAEASGPRTPGRTKRSGAKKLDSSPIEISSDSDDEDLSRQPGPSRGLWTDQYAPEQLVGIMN